MMPWQFKAFYKAKEDLGLQGNFDGLEGSIDVKIEDLLLIVKHFEDRYPGFFDKNRLKAK